MFLESVTELAVDLHDVRAVTLRTPREWLNWLAAEAAEQGDRLTVHAGLDVAGRNVGGPRSSCCRSAFAPATTAGCSPTLEGSLDAAWMGHGRTYLALNFTYDPPLGLVGEAVDRALLHRVAEIVVQRLLEKIANELLVRAECVRPDGPTDAAWTASGGVR